MFRLPASAGAIALSIWTKHFDHVSYDSVWPIPGSNTTAEVVIAGSGNNWGSALGLALEQGRVVVSGVDKTVGLGGYLQGGGHGPVSSTYGLGADQILQVTVVTTTGDILVCNAAQKSDLFWAVRGGGGGQYGVATEFVLMTYPAPSNIVGSSITISAANLSDFQQSTINAHWDAFASLIKKRYDPSNSLFVWRGVNSDVWAYNMDTGKLCRQT